MLTLLTFLLLNSVSVRGFARIQSGGDLRQPVGRGVTVSCALWLSPPFFIKNNGKANLFDPSHNTVAFYKTDQKFGRIYTIFFSILRRLNKIQIVIKFVKINTPNFG